MRALLAITARELRERWTLPLATFCGGFVPLALAIRSGERALPIAAVGAAAIAWTVALILGASVIARDLGDGRLGFFFARPVPWWAIAGGRLLAALLLTIATALAVTVPPALAEGRLSVYAGAFRDAAASGTLAMFLALLVGLVALGHAAGVVYRSRSAWAAFDFVLFAAAVAAVVSLHREFVRLGVVAGGPPADTWSFTFELLLVALVPLAAAAAQVAWGRSDLRRGHRALSLTFWAGALVWFAALGGWLARELATTPAEFSRRHVARAASNGRFVVLLARNPTPGGQLASFLLDTESGRSRRIANDVWPSFSPDAGHAAWVEERPFWQHGWLELQLARLDGPRPVVEAVELEPPLAPGPVHDLALGAGAERIAIVQPRTLSVHELPSGRSLSRSAAADGDWLAAAFLADGRLRALRRVRAVAGGPGRDFVPGYLEAVELAGDVPSSRVRFDVVGHAFLASGIGGERILLGEPQAKQVISLHDIRSGQRLRTFAGEDGWPLKDVLLLQDGGVAAIEGGGVTHRLRIAADGQADRFVELPGLPFIGGELPGGRLTVGLRSGGGDPRRPDETHEQTVVVALDAGEIVRREPGLVPALRHATSRSPSHATSASTLFASDAGELVRLDIDTGRRQIVLAAKAPR